MGCIFVCWRENDIPVISPGDENIALEVTVTNIGGDDAHQSQLSVTFPEFLRLSSVELKKSSVSVPFYWNPKKSFSISFLCNSWRVWLCFAFYHKTGTFVSGFIAYASKFIASKKNRMLDFKRSLKFQTTV